MEPTRLIARILAVVTATALLLAVPLLAESADAANRSCSPGSVSCVDTDGDGLDDSVDGCPTVASSNSTGCPSASRSVSLTWLAGKQRLQAQVTSPVAGCAQRARVALWRVRPHRDYKVFGGTVSFSGRLRVAVARGAAYYVTVSTSYASGVAECAEAQSRKVLAPRG